MKIYIALFILLIGSSTFAQFCTLDNRFTETEYFDALEIDSIIDIEYGSAINETGTLESVLLDAFFPNNTIDPLDSRPAVVMIHGGGFSGGQKEDRWGECIELAKRGYATFSINYRVGWDQSDPNNQLLAIYRAHQDANAAIRYIINNSSTFRIDTNWIFIGGSSAGAITANNLVYTSQDEYETLYPGIGNLLGDLHTSTNSLSDNFTIKGVFNNWGAIFTHSIQASEILPQVAFHGESDGVVKIDNSPDGILMGSRAIHNYILDENQCSDLTVKPGGGHGVYTNANGTIFRASRTSCFFKSLFCNSCTDYYATSKVTNECSKTTSFNKKINTNQWVISPNPFNNHIQISNLNGNEKMTLYNTNGKVIYNRAQITKENFINLLPGIYILVLENDIKNEHFKIIKN